MVFLDANILMEVILPGRPHQQNVREFLMELDETAISALTVHLLFYFGRKAGAEDELLHRVARKSVILGLTGDDYIWAESNERGRDFEDALQMAVALRNNCTSFITLDKKLAKVYTDFGINILMP